jgi:hypothetical protein
MAVGVRDLLERLRWVVPSFPEGQYRCAYSPILQSPPSGWSTKPHSGRNQTLALQVVPANGDTAKDI